MKRRTCQPRSFGLSSNTADRRILFLNVAPVILLVLFSFWPFGGGPTVTLTNGKSVPGAKATVQVSQDSNGNTKIDLKSRYLAPASALTPPAVAYVVWFQPANMAAHNQGVLQVGSDRKGEFKTVTAYKDFDIFVTAEQSPHAQSPSGEKILSGHIARS